MSNRGGKRPGAGRPKGSVKRGSPIDQKNMILNAQGLSALAMETLAEIAQNGESESARISAATQILDRAFGKPLPMALPPAEPANTTLMDVIKNISDTPSPHPRTLGTSKPITTRKEMLELLMRAYEEIDDDDEDAGSDEPPLL